MIIIINKNKFINANVNRYLIAHMVDVHVNKNHKNVNRVVYVIVIVIIAKTMKRF